jgi:hypothetical protein
MNRQLLCVFGAVVICVSSSFAGTVSLQDVNNFPELYVGAPIEVEQVRLEGKMKKDLGFYCLGIGASGVARERKMQDREGYAAPFLSMERITFVADSNLAQKLLNETDEAKTYQVKIRCAVERVQEVGNVYWIARVSQIDFCAPDGAITKTVRAEAVGERDAKGAESTKKPSE